MKAKRVSLHADERTPIKCTSIILFLPFFCRNMQDFGGNADARVLHQVYVVDIRFHVERNSTTKEIMRKSSTQSRRVQLYECIADNVRRVMSLFASGCDFTLVRYLSYKFIMKLRPTATITQRNTIKSPIMLWLLLRFYL